MKISIGYKKIEVPILQNLNIASFEENQRADEGKFLGLLQTADVFVARDLPRQLYGDPSSKGEVFGDTIYGFALVDPAPPNCSANLRVICVAPGWHGRGIGGNILREIVHHYAGKGCSNVRLHVHVDNPAQKLYYDYGFRVYDSEPNYYGDGETALMMRHTFKKPRRA